MPDRSPSALWHEFLSDLRPWKRGKARAVNKPLLTLLLIGRASRGEPAQLRYSEIADPLNELLKEYGPSRSSYHSEYPFWHLQSNGFWVVCDAEAFPNRRAGHSPSRRTLLDGEAIGYVKEDLWTELLSNAALRTQLTDRLLSEFWPETLHAPIRQAVGIADLVCISKSRKKRDPRFRADVIRAYRGECAVCGYDGRLAGALLGIQAAHVKWHSYEGPDTLSNGVALCSFHHLALDAGAMGLDESRRVVVSCEVAGGERLEEQLYRFEGRPIRSPQPGQDELDPVFIEWHREQVFKEPARVSYSESGGESIAADPQQ